MSKKKATTSLDQNAKTNDKISRSLGLASICFGFFLVTLDTTIMNVALPVLGRIFDSDLNYLQWVINSYTLVFASLLLTAGTLGHRFGARRAYLIGFALFTLASLLCSLAPTLNFLIVSRAIQGIGAAMLVPNSLSLLTYLYTDHEERARAVGIWAGIAGISFAGGPIIGGLLIDSWGWHSIFLLNVPVGIVAFEITRRFVSETPRKFHTRFDLVGQLLGIAALFTLTFALIEGQYEGWKSPLILGVLLTSGIAAVLFILVERLNRYPMLPLQIFTSATFSAANVLGFLYNYGLFGLLFVFSLYLQNVRHYSASATGLAFFPLTAVAGILSPFTGWIMARAGLRLPLLIGQASACVGALVLVFVGSKTNDVVIFIGFALFGVGGGFSMPAITATVLASVPKEQSGIASAILNTARQVGSVVGVALLGVMVNRNSFVAGMHFALATVAIVFFVGCILTLAYVPRKPNYITNRNW